MSASHTFDWLTGAMSVPAHAPPEWAEEGLTAFYEHPNDPRWGNALCRVLYHESIHFWQLLSSAYLANIVQSEWLRLLELEDSGELKPANELLRSFTRRGSDEPFSAHELMECWARYWDVHTRSPVQIVREDGITVSDVSHLTTRRGGRDAYTGEAFDLFMARGADARLYAAPYRWLLEQCHGNSALANLLFPVLTFHAFGSPQPVALFMAALEQELDSGFVRLGIDPREQDYSINFHWLNGYRAIVSDVVEPALRALDLPAFTSGWDVINRGPLSSHPVYRPYLSRLGAMFWRLSTADVDPPSDNSADVLYQFALREMARRNPFVLFALPGQPLYRVTLGQYVPPPFVRFTNIVRSEQVLSTARLLATLWGEEFDSSELHFAPVVADLEARVLRFRQAEYAVSLGLPANAFA